MDWAEGGGLVLEVATGIGLAACAGLRAFLPLFVVGLAGRFDLVPLSTGYAWLADWPALIVFGVAVVVELAADKFPVLDHLLDLVQLFVKPCAGALLMAVAVGEGSPLTLTVLLILGGGATAEGVHLTKAKLRLVSTATTAGAANPGLSLTEDVGALAGSAVSLAAPLVLVLLIALGVALGWLVIRGRRRDRRSSRGGQSAP